MGQETTHKIKKNVKQQKGIKNLMWAEVNYISFYCAYFYCVCGEVFAVNEFVLNGKQRTTFKVQMECWKQAPVLYITNKKYGYLCNFTQCNT